MSKENKKTSYHFLKRVAAGNHMLIIILALVLSLQSYARGDEVAEEYLIKAGYVYRFILFVKWPEQVSFKELSENPGTITVGILGEDYFKNYFKDIEVSVNPEKNIKVRIKRLGQFREGLTLGNCQVLFISSSEQRNLSKILDTLKSAPVLTIGDTDNFCDVGGIINIVTVDDRIRFEVNLDRAKKVGLKLESGLLKAAIRVIQKNGE